VNGWRPAAALALVLALVAAACDPGSREAAPFEGRWRSEGFGVYLVVEGGGVAVYEHTALHCLRVGETTAAGIADAASIVDGRLVVEESGRVVRYDPVEALPGRCATPEAGDDARRDFEILAATFSEQAAFLDRRDPGWQERAASIAGTLSASSGPEELFGAVRELLAPLGDAQVRVVAEPAGDDGVWVAAPVLPAVDALRERLLVGETPPGAGTDGPVVAAPLPGGASYLAITGFTGDRERQLARAVDRTLAGAAGGLVLDLRVNGGGFQSQALAVASRFVPDERVVAAFEARVGGTDRFVDAGSARVVPMPTGTFDGPVVVLTGPGTAGSAELLVLALRDLPSVTVVGEPTAGSLSPVMARSLPNGWTVAVPNIRVLDAGGDSWEIIGIPPDEPAPITVEDVEAGDDRGLERALELLAG
jgi:carboxyl-terminal processing protease